MKLPRVLVSQGQSVADAVRAIGVTEVTYYRWRQEYGGLKSDQVRKLKELEVENARLRRAVSDKPAKFRRPDTTLGEMFILRHRCAAAFLHSQDPKPT